MNIDKFAHWMSVNTNLSESSIYKYSRAIVTISNDMINLNVINKNLSAMSLLELDIAIANILSHPEFIKKK